MSLSKNLKKNNISEKEIFGTVFSHLTAQTECQAGF